MMAQSFERTSQQVFFGTSALLFMASAALTAAWCASMSSTMRAMPMPGGWTMSMAWMRMPGQTWLGAAALFVAMWVVMMVAMMLPSLLPNLWRYRQAVGRTGGQRANCLTALVAIGYLFVWTLCRVVVFPAGSALAQIEMQQPTLARIVPIVMGVVVAVAGLTQFSAWKAHYLACCREPLEQTCILTPSAATAWRHGLRLGLHCTYRCAGFTAILLVIGVMDLRAMALVTVAITAERLAPTACGWRELSGLSWSG